MKYNQPYGVGDANASYVNGDPSIGRAGSIPPAEAIENPQRELVALITHANLAAPSDGDLSQVAKAIQSQKLNSDDDEGTQNQYQVTLSPAPGSYYKYLTVRLAIGGSNTNTGASTINVNAMGGKAIVNPDGSAVSAGQLRAGAVVCLVYNGTAFQIAWGAFEGVPPAGPGGDGGGGPIYLAATTHLYVNSATGSDAYDGTSATFTSGIHGPFATLARASTEVNKWNLNGYNVTVHVANGTYTSVNLPDPGGNGAVLWQGNDATPASCLITVANTIAIGAAGNKNYLSGFKITTTGTASANSGACLHAQGGNVVVVISNFEVGPSIGSCFYAYGGAYIRLGGTMKLTGNIASSAFSNGAFMEATLGGRFDVLAVGAQPLTVGSHTCSYFAFASFLSSIFFTYSSLTGTLSSGQKYNASSNSVISSGGGGASYFPGTVAGGVSTGGQYL